MLPWKFIVYGTYECVTILLNKMVLEVISWIVNFVKKIRKVLQRQNTIDSLLHEFKNLKNFFLQLILHFMCVARIVYKSE